MDIVKSELAIYEILTEIYGSDNSNYSKSYSIKGEIKKPFNTHHRNKEKNILLEEDPESGSGTGTRTEPVTITETVT